MVKFKELSGVKMAKISVPTFEGKVLTCKSCWEQIDTTIHCKIGLNNTKKLICLQEAHNYGLARFVIQGLTQMSESYEETIKCLRERYDCPHLS